MGEGNPEEPLIGKKRKRPSKKIEYEIEEEREDTMPRQKVAEKVAGVSKRRASSKSTASSGKSIDF